MCRMKVLLPLALCLVSTVLQAEPAAQTGLRPAAASERRVERFPAAQAAKPSRPAERQRKQAAAVAVAFTDDAEAMWLPPYATRTSSLPIRFLRVGVEWSF
jgi:hypothetical protein